MVTSDVLYGRNVLKPYFDMQRFEDKIYNRVLVREKRIRERRKMRLLDTVLTSTLCVAIILVLLLTCGIVNKSIAIKIKSNDIKRLETVLEKRIYDNKSIIESLKRDLKFDDIKMKAYMELNMITPTEKNIIHFEKSDNEFVRQYENIRK